MKETKNVNKNAVFNTIKSICSIISIDHISLYFPRLNERKCRKN